MIEYKLNLAGCECSIGEWNPDGKTVVLAFHGWLDNLATFETLVNYLPDIRFIAVDFPGHGHSAHLEKGKSYYFLDGLYLIDDLIAHFELSKANLLGHSMGGAIATVYAAVQPERVNKLLLIEALGPITSPENSALSTLTKAVSERRLLKNKRKPIYQTFEQALATRAEVSEISPGLIKPLVERALTKVDKGYTWRADSRLRIPSAIRMSEQQITQLIPNIEASTLLIEAENGLLSQKNAHHIQQRKTLVKSLELHVLAGGHHLHLEYPEKIANILSEFL